MSGIKIFACGDVFIKSSNQKIVSHELKDIISTADISICNFEGSIQSKGKSIAKSGPHLFQSKDAVKILKETGFTVLSFANNHIYDFGDIGLCKTIEEVNENNLDFIGAGMSFDEAYSLKIKEVYKIKIGFLAFSEAGFGSLTSAEDRGGFAWINHPSVNEIVKKSKKRVDFLLIMVHAGAEDMPLPLIEWRNRYQELSDFGADVIIGSHPHVPQGYERYKETMIFYSLGNFYFDYSEFKQKTNPSYSVLLNFEDKKLIEYDIIIHEIENNQVRLVNDEKHSHFLTRLNTYISNEHYQKISEQQAIYLYKKIYENYYKSYALAITSNMNVLRKITTLLKQFFFPNRGKKERELLLLHNIMIESHRYAVQKALSLICEMNYEETFEDFQKVLDKII